MSVNTVKEVKAWENGLKKWDLTEESRKANAALCDNYGRDPFTYTPETYYLANEWYRKHEAPMSHGYPYTAWLQLGLVYCCGIYTAHNQAIIRSGQFFKNFWGHHYFDWIMFARRSAIFGVAGGLIAGTFMFGQPDLAMRRAYSKFKYYTEDIKQDPRNNKDMYYVKMNN